MDLNEVYTLLQVEEFSRQHPHLSEIQRFVMDKLKEINVEAQKETQAKLDAKAKADAQAAQRNLPLEVQPPAEPPKVYPTNVGPVETDDAHTIPDTPAPRRV